MEFEKMFATEGQCREYLTALRWENGFLCPRCGHNRAWSTNRGLYHCSGCSHQTSVIAGTIFEGTHKSLCMWFRAMWHVTNAKSGMNAVTLQHALGLGSYQTAWTWLHKLRRAMVRPGRDRLSGLVEMDETYLGGEEEGVRGRETEKKSLIAIGVEVDGISIGRIRMRQIPDASSQSLLPFVQDAVEPGSTVRTDGWAGYAGLPDLGYTHDVKVLRGKGKSAASNLLPKVHRVVSLLKRWMLGTHQGSISSDHLDYYLDEFTFRFNRRTSSSRGKLFYRLVQQALQIEHTFYREIVGGSHSPI